MRIAKKILITTESREIYIVRMNNKSDIREFCAECATQTEMLMLDEAVSFSSRNTSELIRQIEIGAIHSLETASGHLLVCRNSLEDFL